MNVTITFPIRGNNFRPASAKQVFNDLDFDAEITLVPEPDNKYDPNAIQVHAQGEFIGFVGKEYAVGLVDHMDSVVSSKYNGMGQGEVTYDDPDAGEDDDSDEN